MGQLGRLHLCQVRPRRVHAPMAQPGCAGMEIERTSRLSSALSALQAAAREYKRRRRRPAALIIDNAEQLGQAQDVMRDLLFTGQRCCTLPAVFARSSSTGHAAAPLFCCVCQLAHQPATLLRLSQCSSSRPLWTTMLHCSIDCVLDAKRVHAFSAQRPLHSDLCMICSLSSGLGEQHRASGWEC